MPSPNCKATKRCVREVLGQILRVIPFRRSAPTSRHRTGNIGDQNARDMLIAGLDQKDSKVRASCAMRLSKFPGDEQVCRHFGPSLKRNPSLAVEANLLRAVCTVAKEVPVDLCQAAMNRQSSPRHVSFRRPRRNWQKQNRRCHADSARYREVGFIDSREGSGDATTG